MYIHVYTHILCVYYMYIVYCVCMCIYYMLDLVNCNKIYISNVLQLNECALQVVLMRRFDNSNCICIIDTLRVNFYT